MGWEADMYRNGEVQPASCGLNLAQISIHIPHMYGSPIAIVYSGQQKICGLQVSYILDGNLQDRCPLNKPITPRTDGFVTAPSVAEQVSMNEHAAPLASLFLFVDGLLCTGALYTALHSCEQCVR